MIIKVKVILRSRSFQVKVILRSRSFQNQIVSVWISVSKWVVGLRPNAFLFLNEIFQLYFYNAGQIIADIACGDDTRPAVLFNDTMILETPNFPDHYPDGTLCEWIITPENNINVCLMTI